MDVDMDNDTEGMTGQESDKELEEEEERPSTSTRVTESPATDVPTSAPGILALNNKSRGEGQSWCFWRIWCKGIYNAFEEHFASSNHLYSRLAFTKVFLHNIGLWESDFRFHNPESRNFKSVLIAKVTKYNYDECDDQLLLRVAEVVTAETVGEKPRRVILETNTDLAQTLRRVVHLGDYLVIWGGTVADMSPGGITLIALNEESAKESSYIIHYRHDGEFAMPTVEASLLRKAVPNTDRQYFEGTVGEDVVQLQQISPKKKPRRNNAAWKVVAGESGFNRSDSADRRSSSSSSRSRGRGRASFSKSPIALPRPDSSSNGTRVVTVRTAAAAPSPRKKFSSDVDEDDRVKVIRKSAGKHGRRVVRRGQNESSSEDSGGLDEEDFSDLPETDEFDEAPPVSDSETIEVVDLGDDSDEVQSAETVPKETDTVPSATDTVSSPAKATASPGTSPGKAAVSPRTTDETAVAQSDPAETVTLSETEIAQPETDPKSTPTKPVSTESDDNISPAKSTEKTPKEAENERETETTPHGTPTKGQRSKRSLTPFPVSDLSFAFPRDSRSSVSSEVSQSVHDTMEQLLGDVNEDAVAAEVQALEKELEILSSSLSPPKISTVESSPSPRSKINTVESTPPAPSPKSKISTVDTTRSPKTKASAVDTTPSPKSKASAVESPSVLSPSHSATPPLAGMSIRTPPSSKQMSRTGTPDSTSDPIYSQMREMFEGLDKSTESPIKPLITELEGTSSTRMSSGSLAADTSAYEDAVETLEHDETRYVTFFEPGNAADEIEDSNLAGEGNSSVAEAVEAAEVAGTSNSELAEVSNSKLAPEDEVITISGESESLSDDDSSMSSNMSFSDFVERGHIQFFDLEEKEKALFDVTCHVLSLMLARKSGSEFYMRVEDGTVPSFVAKRFIMAKEGDGEKKGQDDSALNPLLASQVDIVVRQGTALYTAAEEQLGKLVRLRNVALEYDRKKKFHYFSMNGTNSAIIIPGSAEEKKLDRARREDVTSGFRGETSAAAESSDSSSKTIPINEPTPNSKRRFSVKKSPKTVKSTPSRVDSPAKLIRSSSRPAPASSISARSTATKKRDEKKGSPKEKVEKSPEGARRKLDFEQPKTSPGDSPAKVIRRRFESTYKKLEKLVEPSGSRFRIFPQSRFERIRQHQKELVEKRRRDEEEKRQPVREKRENQLREEEEKKSKEAHSKRHSSPDKAKRNKRSKVEDTQKSDEEREVEQRSDEEHEVEKRSDEEHEVEKRSDEELEVEKRSDEKRKSKNRRRRAPKRKPKTKRQQKLRTEDKQSKQESDHDSVVELVQNNVQKRKSETKQKSDGSERETRRDSKDKQKSDEIETRRSSSQKEKSDELETRRSSQDMEKSDESEIETRCSSPEKKKSDQKVKDTRKRDLKNEESQRETRRNSQDKLRSGSRRQSEDQTEKRKLEQIVASDSESVTDEIESLPAKRLRRKSSNASVKSLSPSKVDQLQPRKFTIRLPVTTLEEVSRPKKDVSEKKSEKRKLRRRISTVSSSDDDGEVVVIEKTSPETSPVDSSRKNTPKKSPRKGPIIRGWKIGKTLKKSADTEKTAKSPAKSPLKRSLGKSAVKSTSKASPKKSVEKSSPEESGTQSTKSPARLRVGTLRRRGAAPLLKPKTPPPSPKSTGRSRLRLRKK